MCSQNFVDAKGNIFTHRYCKFPCFIAVAQKFSVSLSQRFMKRREEKGDAAWGQYA